MNNTLKFVKKGVSIAVTSTTILWSVGIGALAPLATHAAQPGQLIKGPSSATVYYLGSDSKRYVFPNPTTYFSWYSDFSGVVTVSQSELESYNLGGNVTIRPGTKLVKITTDPKTYAVEPGGQLRHITSEAIATTLYGANVWGMVVDVPDYFFTNYKASTNPISTNTYPTATLVKSATGTDIYYVDGSTKRMVTSAGLTGNMLNSANVVTAPDSVFNALTAGTNIAALESTIWNVQGGATTGPPIGTGTGLTVALAADSPTLAAHPSGTAYNPALKINLTASADGAVNVTGLTLTRMGVSVDSDIAGVGIFDSANKRHGNFVSFASTKAMADFTNDPIIVPAGQTVAVMAKTNMGAAVTGTYALYITASSDVKTTATVNGTFPIAGNGFSMISGAAVGNLTADIVNITTATVNVDIGSTGYLLQKFRFAQANGSEAVKIKSIRVFNNGTVDDDDLMNYKLVGPDGATIATVEKANGRFIDFVPATPYEIPKGNQRDLSVLVDAKDGSSRTAQLIIQNDYDIEAYGSDTGAGILAAGAGVVDASAFPVGDIAAATAGYNHLTIQQGSLTVNKSSTSPSGEIGVSTSNSVLAIWDLEAKGENIEVQRVDLSITGTGIAAGDFTGTIKLVTDAGQTLYSTTPTSTDGGEMFDADAVATDSQTLSSYLLIPSNTTAKVKLVVDTSTTIVSGNAPVAGLGAVYFKRILSNTYGTSAGAAYVNGNTLTTTTNSLTVVSNAAYASQTMTAGQNNVKIGSMLLKTNNAEGINISSIIVTLAGADAVAAADLSNMKLCKGDCITTPSLQIGSTIQSPALSTNTFTTSGQLNIAANTTVQLDIYVNATSGASDGDGTADTVIASLAASAVSGVGANSGTTIPATSAATLQTITFVQSGSLTISIDQSGAASSQFLTPGLTGVEMARIKLATTNEGAKIQKLELRSVNGGGNIDTVKLLGTGLGTDPVTNITSGLATFTFSSGSEITVAANSSKVLTAVVNTTPVQSLIAGQLGVLGFNTADAIGSGSGVTIQESITGTAYVAGTDAYSGDLGDVVYFTATADAGTNTAPGYYMVTTDDDAVGLAAADLDLNGEATDTSWTTGDRVIKLTKTFTDATLASLSTALAVGDLVYFFDASAVANAGFYTVGTAAAATDDLTNTANELGLVGAADLSAVTYVAGDVVTKFTNVNGLVGNTMRYEEVEPIITLASNSPTSTPTSSPNSEQTIAIFNVKAEGGRDMTFNSLTLQKGGSNSPYRYVSKLSLWNGTTKIAETATTSGAGVADTALTTAVIGGTTGLEFCTTDDGGAAVADEVSGVSAAEYAKLSVGDVVVFSDGTDEITATIATKGALAATCSGVVDTGDNITFSSITQTTGTGAVGTAVNLYNYMVHFAADQDDTGDSDLEEQTITSGQTMTLTVKADTSLVRTGAGTSSVTFGVNIPGATGPLQVTSTQVEGLNWDYTPLGTGTAVYKTEGDGYPIIGGTLTY